METAIKIISSTLPLAINISTPRRFLLILNHRSNDTALRMTGRLSDESTTSSSVVYNEYSKIYST